MSRRRFLLDLACIGGVLALAAGLAATPPPPAPPEAPVADGHHPVYTAVSGGMGRP